MRRRTLSPTARLTLGLISLTASLLLTAQLLGILPNHSEIALEARQKIVTALATQLSWAAYQNDYRTLQVTLASVVEQNDDLLSAAIRRANQDMVVFAGDHDRIWEPREDGLSTPTHVQAPLFASDRLWGTVEFSFVPL